MTDQEYQALLAERQAVQEILVGIPVDNVLDRGSFLARLAAIKAMLEKEPSAYFVVDVAGGLDESVQRSCSMTEER